MTDTTEDFSESTYTTELNDALQNSLRREFESSYGPVTVTQNKTAEKAVLVLSNADGIEVKVEAECDEEFVICSVICSSNHIYTSEDLDGELREPGEIGLTHKIFSLISKLLDDLFDGNRVEIPEDPLFPEPQQNTAQHKQFTMRGSNHAQKIIRQLFT